MELVRVVTADRVRLEGLLYPPAAAATKAGAVDAVIMHHGVGGNFYMPGFFEDAVAALNTLGMTVLRANNRGRDAMFRQYGPDPAGRLLGAAYELMDDSRHDCRAWLDFVAARGCRRIALWGHSLGAVKAIYFAAKERHPALAAVVASSPPRFGHTTYDGHPAEFEALQGYLKDARALIAAGQGTTLMQVMKPIPLTISAASYVDKYGSADNFDYTRYIPNTAVPLLVTIGGREGVDPTAAPLVPFAGATEYLPALGRRNPHMRHAFIPNADHGYTGCEAVLLGTVTDFLARATRR